MGQDLFHDDTKLAAEPKEQMKPLKILEESSGAAFIKSLGLAVKVS